ncbi:winged helix-turn-helix domain-containing protein [Nocardioides sp. AE5]|uniref:ArsR/SmtB family transcription factor n=1 Tax=Nocardioides sp. AE5 TaxID=2962573 RepID=UPI002882B9CE|nr:winged helix-turn-helix domain-containing protein [Nocardioides sp. AE5]MDT0200367.1 winged helix-turn-helix domain-containing protein [Nocardioides sp. AE5]
MSPDDLAHQMAELRERVTRLEAATPPPATPGPDPSDAAETDTFWALDGVRARRADHPATAEGIVLFAGSLELPGGEQIEWQQSAATADTLATDWSPVAATLAALGHPVRLELLRAILNGTRATADLAESTGSTGQLHHHLKQLVTAGWLAQRGRGTYEVPPARVVPLLTILTGGTR